MSKPSFPQDPNKTNPLPSGWQDYYQSKPTPPQSNPRLTNPEMEYHTPSNLFIEQKYVFAEKVMPANAPQSSLGAYKSGSPPQNVFKKISPI